MDFRPTYALMLRQWYLVRSSFTRVLPLFIWVAIDMVVWGFMTRYLNNLAGNRVNFIFSLLGAVLLWDLLIRVMQGVWMVFMEDSWSRNFLNLFASPISIPSYISGLVLTGILSSLVGLFVMIVLAYFIFGLSFLSYGLALVPFLLTLFLFGIALGIFACGIMLRFGPSSEWFVWPIPAILSPFVAVFYPLSTLPPAMQVVSRLLPPTYVFEGIRAIAVDHSVNGGMLAAAVGLTFIYIAAAVGFFLLVFRYVLKTGIIARYSAETLA